MTSTTPDDTPIYFRSYDASHRANPGKVAAVAELWTRWRSALVHVQLIQCRRLRAGGTLGWIDTRDLPGYLSQRQWKSVVNQVNANLRSWAQLAVIHLRGEIRELDVEEAERKRLYRLNKKHRWWDDPVLTTMIENLLSTRHHFPVLGGVRTLQLDSPVARVEESTTEEFRWWVHLSLGPGHPVVRIPLESNPYLDQCASEDRRGHVQVVVHPPEFPSEPTTMTVRLIYGYPAAEPRDTGEVLGMDWGLVNMITTSDGRRLGTRLYHWLQARDRELTELTRRLTEQGVKLRSSRRYRRLQHRITAYVTNEVGRLVNLLGEQQIRELVVEKLDFRGKTLSKTLRRLVNRAGRRVLRRRLAALEQTHGVQITEVSAAYTSQQCSGCGYVCSRNRRTQGAFACGFCGKKLHADVNAARVISRRRPSGGTWWPTAPRSVRAHADRLFAQQWGRAADQLCQRHSGPCSRALSDPGGKVRDQLVTSQRNTT